MAKNGRAVRVDTIIEYMGDKYTEEIYNAILQALEAAGIEIETKQDKEIKTILNNPKKTVDDNKALITTKTAVENYISHTLEEVKKQPDLLT